MSSPYNPLSVPTAPEAAVAAAIDVSVYAWSDGMALTWGEALRLVEVVAGPIRGAALGDAVRVVERLAAGPVIGGGSQREVLCAARVEILADLSGSCSDDVTGEGVNRR